MILPEDITLASQSMTVFITESGRMFVDEYKARLSMATHVKCECGQGIKPKHRLKCDVCYVEPKKKYREKQWDGECMLYADNEFFNDLAAIADYCEENEIDIEYLEIFICEPNYLYELDESYWSEILPEDYESMPKVVQDAIDEFNKKIKEYNKPISWSSTNVLAKFS